MMRSLETLKEESACDVNVCMDGVCGCGHGCKLFLYLASLVVETMIAW